jgi:glycosyltransferase involved in cell wall biosynthesis
MTAPVPNEPAPPLVSVIVRTMARPELARALGCVERQSHRPIEVVLVDAADTGIEPRELRDVALRVVRNGRLERASAANAGLEAAHGEWLLFLDEDDEIEPGHVAQLLAAARASGAPAAYSQTRLVDAQGNTQRIFGGPFHRAALLRSNYLSIHAVLFHRAAVDAGCRLDASLPVFEDWDFWLALSRRGDFVFTGRPTAIYRAAAGQSGAGAGGNLDRERVLAVRERLMRKWGA